MVTKIKKNYVTDNGYRQLKTIFLYNITITCNQNEIVIITVIGNQKYSVVDNSYQ